MTDDKFHTIELALAHQDQQIADLNDMINRQWKEIESLKKLLERTQDKLGQLASGEKDPHAGLSVSEIAALEKPPHY